MLPKGNPSTGIMKNKSMQMENGWKEIPELWEREWSSSKAKVETKHPGQFPKSM